METYTLNVAGLQRELPKVKIHDELAIASFVMFGDTELIETCAEQLVLQKGFPAKDEIDILCCPEAKAIPLIHAVARILGKDYVVARKSVKGYMTNPVIEKVQSKGKRVGVFPIEDGAWIDIGQWEEYRSALKRLS